MVHFNNKLFKNINLETILDFKNIIKKLIVIHISFKQKNLAEVLLIN